MAEDIEQIKRDLADLHELVDRLTFREEGQAAAVNRLLAVLFAAQEPSGIVGRALDTDTQIQAALGRGNPPIEEAEPISASSAYDRVIKLVLSHAGMLRESNG